MARLANTEKLGFYPLPGTSDEPALIAKMIASYINMPSTARFADLCAGEFEAGTVMCDAWGIPYAQRYANELHEERAQGIRDAFALNGAERNVLNANTLTTLQVSRGMFQVMLTNPPFDTLEAVHEGGRLEPKFFRRIDDGGWIQPGGIHIMVSPRYVFARPEMITIIARTLDKVRIYDLPEEVGPYAGAIIVFGVVRAGRPTLDEMNTRTEKLNKLLKGTTELPILSFVTTPPYTAPEPMPLKRMVWQDRSNRNVATAMADIIRMGGAYSSRAYQDTTRLLQMGSTGINPIFPLSPAQVMLRIANGDINNEIVTLGGEQWRIKGSTVASEQKWEEVENKGDTVVKTEHRVVTQVPVITLVGQKDGRILLLQGNEGLQRLFAFSDSQNVIDAVMRACPAVYDGNQPPWLKDTLRGLRPQSGRALRGQQPGLNTMQRHMAAAMVLSMTEPHRITGEPPQKNVILSAEMASGKTSVAAVTARVMAERYLAEHPDEPYFILVSGPGHVIGDKKALTKYREALAAGKKPKAELSDIAPHVFEFQDWIPHARIDIIESPAQMGSFIRTAQPGTINIMLVSVSKMSLSSGRTIGFSSGIETGGNRKVYEWRDALHTQLTAAIENRKKKSDRELVVDANDEVKEAEMQILPGVSARTMRRDRILRAGVAGRLTRVFHGKPETRTVTSQETGETKTFTIPTLDHAHAKHMIGRIQDDSGCYCVRCGELLVNDKAERMTPEALRKAGATKKAVCQNCGEPFYQIDRTYDSVEDRGSPQFDLGPLPKDLPFGKRPESNPRIPLGDFLAKVFPGKVNLFIADEAHMYAAPTSDRGRIFGSFVEASQHTLALTGTVYGGLASTIFYLMKRLGNRTLAALYDWTELSRYQEELGIIDYVTRTSLRATTAHQNSGKGESITKTKIERPGITARLAAIIQQTAAITLLKQMGFSLVPYEEDIVNLTVPSDILFEYKRLLSEGVGIIKEPGGHDALSSYLQCALTYMMAPWRPMAITSRKTGGHYAPPQLEDRVLPHHEWIADYIIQQKEEGRRVLFYVEHTGKLDLLNDIIGKVSKIAEARGVTLNLAALRSESVKTTMRMAWFKKQVDAGVDAVFCHPKLVETGVNLIEWPSIVFVEPTYSLYTANQAKRRAWRPTQTKHCTVTWLVYEDTMAVQAIGRIGRKAASAALLAGDELSSSLLVFDQGMSLLQMLAQQVQGAQAPMSLSDVRSAIQSAGRSLVGTATEDLGLGEDEVEAVIEAAIEEAVVNTTSVLDDGEDSSAFFYVPAARVIKGRKKNVPDNVYQMSMW